MPKYDDGCKFDDGCRFAAKGDPLEERIRQIVRKEIAAHKEQPKVISPYSELLQMFGADKVDVTDLMHMTRSAVEA